MGLEFLHNNGAKRMRDDTMGPLLLVHCAAVLQDKQTQLAPTILQAQAERASIRERVNELAHAIGELQHEI